MPETGSAENGETQPTGSGAVIGPKALEVRGLPCFDPKGEPTTLSIRWKKWKRAFNLYVACIKRSDEGSTKSGAITSLRWNGIARNLPHARS